MKRERLHNMILNNAARYSLHRIDYTHWIYIGDLSKYMTEYTIKRVNVFQILTDVLEQLNIKIYKDKYIIRIDKDIESFNKIVDKLRRLYYEKIFKLAYSAINEGYEKADYYLGIFNKETFEMSNVNIHYPLYNKNNFEISDYYVDQLIDIRSLLKMNVRNYTIGTVIFDIYTADNIKKRYLDKSFFKLEEKDINKWKPIVIESFERNDLDILIDYVIENNFYNEEMKTLLYKTFTYKDGKISFDTLVRRKDN